MDEAKRRVINRENRRSTFIQQSFNADVSNPNNYDLVINTEKLDIDAAMGAVIGMVVGSKGVVHVKNAAAAVKKSNLS
jgi:cytidylate kinase